MLEVKGQIRLVINQKPILAYKEDTLISIKERYAKLVYYGPQIYDEYEHYYRVVPAGRLTLMYKSMTLDDPKDDKKLSDYDYIEDGSLLFANPPMGRNGGHPCLQIVCIANNVKFTTFTPFYRSNTEKLEDYTVGQFKAKLSKFVHLAGIRLYLKKKGVDELDEITNDDAALPLKDIYAALDGDIAIEPRTDGLHLYKADDGRIFSGINGEVINEEDRHFDEPDKKPFFSNPKPESIVPLTPEQRKDLITCVGIVNPPQSKVNPSPEPEPLNPYAKPLIITGAATGLISAIATTSLFGNSLMAQTALHSRVPGVVLNYIYVGLFGVVIGASLGLIASHLSDPKGNEPNTPKQQAR